MKPHYFSVLFAAACLAACSQSPQPAVTPSVPTSGIATAPPTNETQSGPADPGCEFCAVPATVKRCEVAHGARTTLFWDVATKGVKQVVIYVVDKNGVDQHFGKGPAKGSKVTGPWLKPGLQFKLKDAQGKELGIVTIDGVDC